MHVTNIAGTLPCSRAKQHNLMSSDNYKFVIDITVANELQYLVLAEGKISKILLIVINIINHYGHSRNYQYKK